MRRDWRTRAASLLLAGLVAAGAARAGDNAALANAGDSVNEDWLPGIETIVYWHWQKHRLGPALTGNASWRHFLEFVEGELTEAGVVDIERNRWQFRRWHPATYEPSADALTVSGRAVPVAAFGANSGATSPEGLTAALTLFEDGRDLAGRIVVMPLTLDPAVAQGLATTDYEYQAPIGTYPWSDDVGRVGPGTTAAKPPDDSIDSVSWRIFPQLMQLPGAVRKAREGNAAGLILIADAGEELAAGLYTFPVPALYDIPTLIVARDPGREVIAAAERGAEATIRLRAEVVESDAYQLIGYLPGRDYGTPDDEVIRLVTHTDGPSISQDNGALGLLGVVQYFAELPREHRPRTLMVYLDCRHYMPGQEHDFAAVDYLARQPEAAANLVAVVGMEHLGQIEYVEQGDELMASGRIDPSMVWTTDSEALMALAKAAIIDNELPSATLRNIFRPGIHGGSQGRWYGMANPERAGGLPAVAIMGTMGGYWGTSSGLARLDPELFRRQVATFVQITGGLMTLEELDR
ncbi:hypothetical protein [Lentisalinibacter salinarum]|uniref:hypothetical protein n=1 Tax=Lentisalinibacter salinarum TaxID=2992239 RepID=UPI0038685114